MRDILQNENSIYQLLFENAGDAILIHSESKFLAVNRKACEMLGYSEDELLMMTPTEIDAYEERMYEPEHMANLKKHKLITFETTQQKKDGTVFPVEVTSRSIVWNGEEVVMSICRDITVKKNYDKLLLHAALEWQQTFDAIKDAVFLLSPDCRILRCNKASYEMFKKSKPGEILGKFCWEIVHGTHEQFQNCPVAFMQKTKKRSTAVLKSDERWLEVTVDPVLDGNNNISGTVHVVADITERKLLDEALRRKNFAFDFSTAANSIADPCGIITEVNDAFLKLWGYQSKKDVLGKPIRNFLDAPNSSHDIISDLKRTGKWDGSYTAMRKDGTTFIAHGMATVLKDDTGMLTGYQSEVIDISGDRIL